MQRAVHTIPPGGHTFTRSALGLARPVPPTQPACKTPPERVVARLALGRTGKPSVMAGLGGRHGSDPLTRAWDCRAWDHGGSLG